MKNFDDYQLDRLFKSKAQNAGEEPEFDVLAWEAMERLLDKRKRKIALYYWSVAALFLAMLSFGWLLWDNHQDLNLIQKTNLAQQKNKKLNSIIKDEVKVTDHQFSSNNKNKQLTKIKQTLKNQNSKSFQVNHQLKYKEVLNYEVSSADLETNSEELLIPTRVKSISRLYSSTDHIFLKPLLFKEEEITVSQNIDENKSKTPIIWNLGFAVGPEINTLGGGSRSGKNLNTGLCFSGKYKKIGLYLGANYGVKSYAASNTQYQNLKPAIANEIANINASCNILEVPFGISYQVLTFKKKSIELNTGLSSYFMLKENYTYQYASSYGLSDRDITRINRNQHYFKVLNLSAIYHIKLNKNLFDLGIEPYAKLPLAGVGEGQVHLKSYGMSLHFNYQIKRNKYSPL